MAERLPGEILLHILGDIDEDNRVSFVEKLATYHAFGLTCKTLHEISRLYLYKTVYLARADRSQAFLEAVKENRSLGAHTRNIFYGIQESALRRGVCLPTFTALCFPKVKEVAWIEERPNDVPIGHQYSISRDVRSSSTEDDFRSIWAYHLLSPEIFKWPHSILPFSESDYLNLTHVTITFWKA
jgi:hypothetical protein